MMNFIFSKRFIMLTINVLSSHDMWRFAFSWPIALSINVPQELQFHVQRFYLFYIELFFPFVTFSPPSFLGS